MKRRNLLKAVIVAPIMGIIKPAKTTARGFPYGLPALLGQKPIPFPQPDWSELSIFIGYDCFLFSIKDTLEKFLKKSVSLERDGESAGFFVLCEWNRIYLLGVCCNPEGTSEYEQIWRQGYSDKKTKDIFVRMLETRWVDCLWSLNDGINDRLDLIRSFSPGYEPIKIT